MACQTDIGNLPSPIPSPLRFLAVHSTKNKEEFKWTRKEEIHDKIMEEFNWIREWEVHDDMKEEFNWIRKEEVQDEMKGEINWIRKEEVNGKIAKTSVYSS